MGLKSGIPIRSPLLRWTALAIVMLLTVPLLAQTGARIDGTVADQTGAVVPNAKITALNVKTQIAKQATSNAQGLYLITPVDPGIYNITVEATGFTKSVMNGVEVNVAGTYTADFKLTVGSTSESVEVVANQVTVQTSESAISRAITLKDIDTLPQLGRTPITLAVYQPGVQINPGDTSYSRVSGQRLGSNNTTLDGIDVNDSVVPRLGLSMTANNTDSVGEFRIVSQGAKAEYGRNAGGQVELITRSGTNTMHGNAFDYLRNTVLNANDFFNKNFVGTPTPRPKFIQNMFGGSYGGPILKNKLFIFGNYQGVRTRQEVIRNRTVYTAAAKQGIFTYCTITPAAGTPCPDANRSTYNFAAADLRAIGVDPQVKKILALIPNPNNTDIGDGMNTAGFRFNNPNNSYSDQFTIKGDYNITDRMKTFLRWSWQRNSSIDSLNSADAPYPGMATGTQGGHRWGYSIGHDWVISNTLANEVRVGHQSATTNFLRPQRLQGPTYITNLVTDPISSAYAQGRNSPVYDIIDNMTWTKGNHIFKWGGKIAFTKQWGFRDDGIWYNVTTSSTANGNTPTVPATLSAISSAQKTQYQSLYNDMMGRMDSVAHTWYSNDLNSFQDAGISRSRNHSLKEHGYFFQDDWKMFRNFTVNLGVRWELFLPPVELDGRQATIANAGQITPTNTSTALTIQKSSEWYKTDWNNFAPRAGFAWDVKGDGKTAIRGNYGLFYDRNTGATVSLADLNTPGFSQSATLFPQTMSAAQLASYGCSAPLGDVRFNDCVPISAKPAAPSLTLPVSTRTTSIVLFNPSLRTGYVHSFSLTMQREVVRNTILEVGYVGALGVKLFMDRDFNQLRTPGDFLQSFKELQTYNAGGAFTGALAPATNTLVKAFMGYSQSTANATYAPTAGQPCSAQPNPLLCANRQAIAQLGATNITNGNVGTAANTLDRSFNSLYAGAGLPQTYLRNYPQFNQVIVGTNDGHSYYNALQVSVRRYVGALRVNANYTFSRSIDTLNPGGSATSSAADGNGFTSVLDNFNLRSNKAISDFDHHHSFNGSVIYAMPFGAGQRFGSSWPKWLDTAIGGWEIGELIIVQDGAPFTVSSTRTTFSNVSNTYANFNGPSRHIGQIVYKPDGSVWWLSANDLNNFSYPAAGEYGNVGRNVFRLPGYFDIDMSLVKRFKITERHVVTFRAEAYNLLNKTNFSGLSTSLTTPSTFGKLSSTTGPAGTSARNLQLTLRYDF